MNPITSDSDAQTRHIDPPNGARASRASGADAAVPLSAEAAAERLATQRDELRLHLRSLAQDDDDEGRPRFSNHLAEDAQDQQIFRSAAAMRQVILGDLRQVEHALDRASSGQYGLCEDCGHEIPSRRLQALPAATLCVGCQSQREARRTVH